jgi:hypothetical protein
MTVGMKGEEATERAEIHEVQALSLNQTPIFVTIA